MTFLLTGFHKVSLITCFFPGIGTNALVTEIVFTFVAMPRPVFIWVPKQRSAVITSPATSRLWVDIQCACSEQCMLVAGWWGNAWNSHGKYQNCTLHNDGIACKVRINQTFNVNEVYPFETPEAKPGKCKDPTLRFFFNSQFLNSSPVPFN